MNTDAFNQQIMMRLDTIDKNTVQIIASSSGNAATLTALQQEFSSYRKTLHDRFNAITEEFAELESQSEERYKKLLLLEFRVNLIYRVLAGIGAVVLAALGLLTDVFHNIVHALFNTK